MIVTCSPRTCASLAYVAIRSSASNPAISIDGSPKARVASRISGNCGISSSGGGGLLALYSGYMSVRKVVRAVSNSTAKASQS